MSSNFDRMIQLADEFFQTKNDPSQISVTEDVMERLKQIHPSTMSEHIDLDVSAILKGAMTFDEAGDMLLEMLIRTCNGRLTASEVLGHEEFVPTKLYRSA